MPLKQPLTLEEIEALGDADDVRRADEVLAEMARTGEKPRPWAEVEAELDALEAAEAAASATRSSS